MKKLNKWIALLLAAILAVLPFSASVSVVQAGKKTVTLNKAKFSMEPGSSTQLKVQNTSKSKVQSVTWSVIKGKDVVKLSAKSKKSVIVKAVKKGKATIQAKIKTSNGTFTRKAVVTVSNNRQPVPETTQEPASSSPAVQVTDTEVKELIHYNMYPFLQKLFLEVLCIRLFLIIMTGSAVSLD